MKHALISLLLVLMATAALTAAEEPKIEVFGGWSYQYLDSESYPKGWNAALTAYLLEYLGITADFSGFYRSWDFQQGYTVAHASTNIHYFLFGPQLASRQGDKVSSFWRVLVGAACTHIELTGGMTPVDDSSTDFAIGTGGGLDIKLTDSISWRVVQVDYIYVSGEGHAGGNSVRMGIGLVFKAK